MYEFLVQQRQEGNVTDEMLDLYLGVFIDQKQYDELKAIEIKSRII